MAGGGVRGGCPPCPRRSPASLSSRPRFIENNDIQALSKATFRGLKSLTHL